MRSYSALTLLTMLGIVGCNGDVYLRDGVTDGDAFFLSTQAMAMDDPVTQSWVSYSLTRSACQLTLGGTNPARNTSFNCELVAREHLLETWREQQLGHDPDVGDAYLNDLQRVASAGYLPEYVAYYFRRPDWTLPGDLDTTGFARWRRAHLGGHRKQTRITGGWGYRNAQADEVRPAPR